MRGLLKRLRLAALVLVVVAALAGGAVFLLPRFAPGLLSVHLDGADPVAAATPAPAAESVPVTLGERVVNLADPGGFRYLKTEIVLGLTAPGMPTGTLSTDQLHAQQAKLDAAMEPIKPQVQDVLTSVLTAKTVADVSTPQGKEQLRQELLTRLQPLFGNEQITGVYFAQFVIQ